MNAPTIDRPATDGDNLDMIRRANNLRALTPVAEREARVAELTSGKIWCYAAVPIGPAVMGLGIVIANEVGFIPIPFDLCHALDAGAMDTHVTELNAARGIDPPLANRIWKSTWRRP